MKMLWNEQNIKENFGEVLYIGAEVKREYKAGVEVEDQKIKSIAVNIGVTMQDKPILVRLVKPTKDYKFKNSDIPNIKKFGNVKFQTLEYDPKGVGNHMNNDDGGFTWGTLDENFNAMKVLPATPADRLVDEKTGEKLTGDKPEQTGTISK